MSDAAIPVVEKTVACATPLRFGAFRQDTRHVRALERVKGWTRESLLLAENETVLVAEVACARAGCPPLETVVTFWTGAGERHWFKVFKPVTEVSSTICRRFG